MTIQTQIPLMMQAVAISQAGGPEVLRLVECPVPRPTEGEVLIKISAAGVNRPDLLQCQGKYAPPPGVSELPGLEVAGVVVAHGANMPLHTPRVGARVCALLAGGGYAEYAVAPVGQVLPVPDHLSDAAAAALPEGIFTLYQNLWQRGQLRPGESVLIHGGTSGIGTLAIKILGAVGAQLGRPHAVYVTCGSEAKCVAARAHGAMDAINYQTMDFKAEINRLTHGAGVDLVLDMVGGDYVPRNLACLAEGGRHISIATQGGVMAHIDLRQIMGRHLTLTGGTLRLHSVAEKTVLRDLILQNLWPLVCSGAITPLIHAVYPLSQAVRALQELESGQVMGKLVLIP